MLDKLEQFITRESCDQQYSVTISITVREKRAELGGQEGAFRAWISAGRLALIASFVAVPSAPRFVPFVNLFGHNMARKAETGGGLGQ